MMHYDTISLGENDTPSFRASGGDRYLIRLEVGFDTPLTILCSPEQAEALASGLAEAVAKARGED